MSDLTPDQQISQLYQKFIRSVHTQAWNMLKDALQVQHSANDANDGNDCNDLKGHPFISSYSPIFFFDRKSSAAT
jgi:hypothetical protein